jgi:phage tail sheath protein FI
MVGDWVYWQDTVNSVRRMMAPATFSAAEIAALSPHQSPLNKALSNAVSTQRNLSQSSYSQAEIGAINTARLDVITNPCPGGSYFGHRSGLNCSSNQAVNGDNYTRMTNFVSLTLAASFGYVVGQLQTLDLRRETKSTIESFLQNLVDQGMIGDVNGGPAFSVQLDASNNSDSRVALGYMQADVQVKYLSVVRYFLVNLEAGQSVSIVVSSSPRS